MDRVVCFLDSRPTVMPWERMLCDVKGPTDTTTAPAVSRSSSSPSRFAANPPTAVPLVKIAPHLA